jgi:endoglucanase
MIRKLLPILFLYFLSNTINGQALWNNTSFVHRNNKQLLDGQNNVVKLNGVNLGGWLMWEGWIWGGGYTQQKTIYNNIKTVVGTTAADAFRDSIHKGFISRRDIQKISQECFNVVRIPFNSSLLEDDFTPYVYKQQGWATLDSVLSWCEMYNVYAILDMHSAPGGQSTSFTADPDLFVNLWNGAVNQKRTKLMWKAIANRYKNRGIIAAYDLLNEPNVSSDSTMLAMYNDITDSIRTVDLNHLLMIEGNNYATDFTMFTSLHDSNTAFQFHFYTWFFSNAIASHLNSYTAFSNSINAPIWCGEWGENDYQELDTTLALFNSSAYGVSGSAFWTWKKMTSGSGAYRYYTGIDTTYEWNKSMNWISNTSLPQPTALEMQTGMNAFLQNMKFANCQFNDTLAGILRTCLPTNIDEYMNDSHLKLYPNPNAGIFTLETSLSNAIIEIIDVLGRTVIKTSCCKPEKQAIDLSVFDKGVYLIRITNEEKSVSMKIVVE